jgi:glycosyltransferase involved in cell wall biosynthesis
MKSSTNKLIYLSYSSIPSPHANSLQVMEMCHALADTGMEIELYALHTSVRTPAFQYYDLPKNRVHIHRIRMPRIKLISRFLYGLRVVFSMFLISQRAIIYGRDFYTLALHSVLPGRQDSPVFFEAHQPPQNDLEGNLQKLIFSSSAFAGLLTITQVLKDEYLRRYPMLKADQIEVLPDAARPFQDSVEFDSVSTNNKPVLGYVGSLQIGKGMETISQIAAQLPHLEFHIVGGADRQISIWQSRCGDNVIFHGHQPAAGVRELIHKFDIVLAPYRGKVIVGRKQIDIARWMSPLKIFEYMAAARPMIVSDLPVLREVLQDEKNCLLAAPDDIEDWVRQIKRLSTHAQLRVTLSQQAYQDFVAHYTWQKRAEKLKIRFDHCMLNSRNPVS